MTSSRLLLGFAVAVVVGLIVARLPLTAILRQKLADSLTSISSKEKEADHHQDHDHHDCSHSDCNHGHHHHHGPESSEKLVAAFRSAMKDFVDVAVYFAVGVSITALFNTGIAPGAEWLDSLAGSTTGAPAALMVLAFVLSLCSTSDAFIAATLDKFPWAAKLAFLTFGPMMDVKLIFLYQTVLRKRFIILLGLGLFLGIGTASLLLQHWAGLGPQPIAP